MPSRRVSVVALFAVLATSSSTSAVTLTDPTEFRTAEERTVVPLRGGGTLALGSHTTVRVYENRPYNFNRIEIVAGSAVLLSRTSAPVVACGTDAGLSSGGVFRFDVLDPERIDGTQRCRIRVYEGAASTPGASVTYVLRDGQQMIMNRRAGDMIPVDSLDVSILDQFDRWAREQIR